MSALAFIRTLASEPQHLLRDPMFILDQAFNRSVYGICVNRGKRFSRLPIECRPQRLGCYSSTLRLVTNTGLTLSVTLTAQFSKETTF